ncbi:MAG: DUF3783 domain-containing protein [Spirochaetales bacterium]|nr:DUF3783 domain-containing protein [Spirochaetales bacterium]
MMDDMNESSRIVVLLEGFSKEQATSALAAYGKAGGDASSIIIAPITDRILDQKTESALNDVLAGKWAGGTVRKEAPPGALIAFAGKSEAVALTRCLRCVLASDSDPAFAMVTETGSSWNVGDYLTHVRKEHEFMKNADPSQDPDMKAME